MVKYLGMIAVVVASLTIAEQAQAFGRHGCKSCGGGGGCPGGNCAVNYAAPAKSADMSNAPPGLAAAPAPASTPAVTAERPAPASYAYVPARRGLFGRR
jgi:hypothetical protein